MTKPVVEIRNLSRSFGPTHALSDVNLELRPGKVYGLVGSNGHGKTTLIRHMLGLWRAQRGEVRVFGLNPVEHPEKVLVDVGYLSEERDLPEWMTVDELLRYTSAFHPQWDHSYALDLLRTFQLDAQKKVKNLSKGMRAQVGLIAAVSHRPRLLLLDEPSTGLDAVVRRDILNQIIHAVAEDGRTVLFSSHLLDEVELMSDSILMINRGKLVLEGDLDEVKEDHHVATAEFKSDGDWRSIDACLAGERIGRQWKLTLQGQADACRRALLDGGAELVQMRQATLQEIFLARVGRRPAAEPTEALQGAAT